jgi:hypothetical protein
MRGRELEVRCDKLACNNGAVRIPVKPWMVLGYNPYQKKSKSKAISNSFTIHNIATKSNG